MFGDIIAIYNGATKVAEYAYDAWGNCTIVSDTNYIGRDNPFRYRGYYWDNDLQLYYLMSRYYDPQTGRFINADSLEYLDPKTIGGLNLYAYCGNNPVMRADPMGTISITLIAGLIGFGISFVSSIISQATDKEDGEINWVVAIVDGIFGAIDGVLSASGLKLNPILDTVLDVCLDGLNNCITTLIKNKGEVSGKDILNIGVSAFITGVFSYTSSVKKWGFDGDFIKRVQPEMKNINRKLSEGLYKTTQQSMNAQKTIRSYFNQAFSGDVYNMYGMDIMANVMKGILT